MTCQALAARLQQLQPDASPQTIARLCLLILQQDDNLPASISDEALHRVWQSTCLRLEAAADQHAAMTAELESIASAEPVRYDPRQIFALLRAIKVQNQILELYVDEPQCVSQR
jgi:hypothetical protein